MSEQAREWRENWRTAAACSIGVATGFSMLPYNASVFIVPWQHAFGWSRGEIAAANYGMFAMAVLSPIVGNLIDRFGVRRPMLIAMVLTGLSYLAMTRLTGSLFQFYATYLAIQVFGIPTTAVTFTRVIATRFEASRGLALATTRVGISVFGAVLPSLIYAAVARFGWQAGFHVLAGLILLVGLPVCWFGVRDLPVPPAAPRQAAPEAGQFRQLLRKDRRILLLCISSGLSFGPMGAIISQFQPMMTGKGIDPAHAAALSGVLAGSVLIGTLVSGVLIDRIWAPIVAALFNMAPLLGCLILLNTTLSLPFAILIAVLVGMAHGSEIDIVAYLAARYFGLRHYSTIYGSITMSAIAFSTLAQVATGYLFDHFGNYTVVLAGCATALAASTILYLRLGPYPDAVRPVARPA